MQVRDTNSSLKYSIELSFSFDTIISNDWFYLDGKFLLGARIECKINFWKVGETNPMDGAIFFIKDKLQFLHSWIKSIMYEWKIY